MKKIILSSFIFLSLLCCTCGCSDFLTENPKSIHSSSGSFNDDASIKLLLLGAYESYNSLYYNCQAPDNGGFLGMIGTLGTDEIVLNQWASGTQFHSYTGDPEDKYKIYQRWYRQHYDVITRANSAIFYGERVENPSSAMKSYVAEAKCLRAWSYFRLAQTFGPVPLILEPVEPPVDYGMARSPLKDIYKQIVIDLEEAVSEKVMQDDVKTTPEPGRLTHWAGKAMLGKVYLTMASHKESGCVDKALATIGKENLGYGAIEASIEDLYKKAQETLKDIVDNSGIHLNMETNGYGRLFCAENRNKYPENMWEIQAADGASNSLAVGRGFSFLGMYGLCFERTPPVRNCCARQNGQTMPGASMLISDAPYYGYWDEDRRATWVMTGGARLYPGSTDYNPKPYAPKLDGDKPDVEFPWVFAHQYNPGQHRFNANYPWLQKYHTFKEIGNFAAGNTSFHFQIRISKYRFNDRDRADAPTPYTDFLNLPRNFTVIRYADVLLMYAEACLKVTGNGSDPEALKCMNAIRDRARGWYTQFEADHGLLPEGREVGQLVPVEDTPQLPVYTSITMDDIMAERKWELCYENVRWFDLVRTGRLIETINKYHPVGKGILVHRTDLDEHDCLFPIPNYELNQTTDKEKFFQNPGF